MAVVVIKETQAREMQAALQYVSDKPRIGDSVMQTHKGGQGEMTMGMNDVEDEGGSAGNPGPFDQAVLVRVGEVGQGLLYVRGSELIWSCSSIRVRNVQ